MENPNECACSNPRAALLFRVIIQLLKYYLVRGWDAGGVPTKEKLNELSLELLSLNDSNAQVSIRLM